MKFAQRVIPVLLLSIVPCQTQAADEPVATLTQQETELERLSSANPKRAEQTVATDFSKLAGSSSNSTSLVSALRTGSNFDLVMTDKDGKTVTTTIDPATGPMGLGNVFISLALAQESLKQAGISNPTPEQLAAALNGGAVTVDGKTINLGGVLAQRAGGGGWGQIAKSLGVKLGAVVSAIRSENGRLRSAEQRERRAEKAGDKAAAKREMSDRRAEQRAERNVGRPDRPDRPEKPNKPDHPDRPGRP